MSDLVNRIALRDALYEADAVTMQGVKIINQFPAVNAVTENERTVTAMAEYIKRDEVIAALDEFRLNQTVSKYATVMQCRAARDAISRATKVLESLPAADVEPVRHGRWIQHLGHVECLECRNRYSYLGEAKYCPNCGADMREEVDNAQE